MDKYQRKRVTKFPRRCLDDYSSAVSQRITEKISNWNTPDHDGIHGFKKFCSIRKRLGLELKKTLKRYKQN